MWLLSVRVAVLLRVAHGTCVATGIRRIAFHVLLMLKSTRWSVFKTRAPLSALVFNQAENAARSLPLHESHRNFRRSTSDDMGTALHLSELGELDRRQHVQNETNQC